MAFWTVPSIFFVHTIRASPPAMLHLNCAPYPFPLQDPCSKELSSWPKEVPGGHMPVDLGLWYGISHSTPTTQVKDLWAYTMLPKSDASS